jgi:hypothetical protein
MSAIMLQRLACDSEATTAGAQLAGGGSIGRKPFGTGVAVLLGVWLPSGTPAVGAGRMGGMGAWPGAAAEGQASNKFVSPPRHHPLTRWG